MDRPTRKLDRRGRRALSAAYLPSRWHVHYARSKLATDPLYHGVANALDTAGVPLLDLGCGIGLLPHYLAAVGRPRACLGLDCDRQKIDLADRAAKAAGLVRTRFMHVDLTDAGAIDRTGHRGSVVMLDLLQYVSPDCHEPMLRQAAARVSPDGRLVLRTGLQEAGTRSRMTRAGDVMAHVLGWMNAGPRVYPRRDWLAGILEDEGLEVEIRPLWGHTPFNNWLVTGCPR